MKIIIVDKSEQHKLNTFDLSFSDIILVKTTIPVYKVVKNKFETKEHNEEYIMADVLNDYLSDFVEKYDN